MNMRIVIHIFCLSLLIGCAIWRIKDELSASYGHDVDRLCAEARKRQEVSGHQVVNLQTKQRKAS
jgi:hypothetical protein